ncbi:MAG TPA: putative peptidoglycan glycosyltransferase FtsW [Patescibacteria group bacterium]|nr:putative peptidoglycan glycosyltransferase FtsW [Patescibacteria group bacterium]
MARRTAITSQPLGTRRHRPDYWILILAALLLAIGLIVVYAISPALIVEKHVSGSFYITRQLVAVGLSIVAFGVTAAIPMEQWKKWHMPLLVFAAVATMVALAMPTNPDYPAHRWIRLGGLSFQSVELLKFALLVWLSALLSKGLQKGTLKDDLATLKPLLICLGAVGVVVAIVQSDFGSMAVIAVMMAAMVFVAGMPMRRLVMVAGIGGIAAILAISAVPYRRERITAFLHQNTTNCSELKTGYQACRAMVAVGSGGMIGLGLGRSVQAFGYLPEAENDSIFAIYAEKFGFIGITVLLGLLIAFFGRIKRVMERAPDDFSRLIATGVFAWLATQTLINIGAMIGLLPLKGITLPFISYGGTSVLFVMAAVGLVFQISRYTLYSVPRTSNVSGRTGYEDSRDRRRVRGAYHPNPGSRS